MTLTEHIADHEAIGSLNVSRELGIQKIPEGYALMIDPDEIYYYWLREDGKEGSGSLNKWTAYRGAKANKSKIRGK